jgi:hypothetical protein
MRAFVWDSQDSQWIPLWVTPLGTFKFPTQMLSYNHMNNQSLHIANIDFDPSKVFFGLPQKFRRP